MTDKKQIIINGVDVVQCADIYCGTNCGNTGNSCPDIKCENNPNCYYKQLQRKERENLILHNKNNRLGEELNQIKLLLEGKNTQYCTLKQEYQDYIENSEIVPKTILDNFDKMENRYKQALGEIEEKMQEINPYSENNVAVLDNILIIINEVKKMSTNDVDVSKGEDMINKKGCHNCVYSKTNGLELICIEWQEAVEDSQCLCSCFVPIDDMEEEYKIEEIVNANL